MGTPLNFLDIGLVIILGVSVVSGLLKGLIREVFGLAGVLAGILVFALLFSPRLGEILEGWIGHGTASYAAAFIVLFVITLSGAGIVGHFLSRLLETVQLGPVNRALGGLFGLARGGLIALTLVLGMTLFLQPEAPLISESRMTPHLAKGARWLAPFVPEKARKVLLERLDEIPSDDGIRKSI